MDVRRRRSQFPRHNLLPRSDFQVIAKDAVVVTGDGIEISRSPHLISALFPEHVAGYVSAADDSSRLSAPGFHAIQPKNIQKAIHFAKGVQFIVVSKI